MPRTRMDSGARWCSIRFRLRARMRGCEDHTTHVAESRSGVPSLSASPSYSKGGQHRCIRSLTPYAVRLSPIDRIVLSFLCMLLLMWWIAVWVSSRTYAAPDVRSMRSTIGRGSIDGLPTHARTVESQGPSVCRRCVPIDASLAWDDPVVVFYRALTMCRCDHTRAGTHREYKTVCRGVPQIRSVPLGREHWGVLCAAWPIWWIRCVVAATNGSTRPRFRRFLPNTVRRHRGQSR